MAQAHETAHIRLNAKRTSFTTRTEDSFLMSFSFSSANSWNQATLVQDKLSIATTDILAVLFLSEVAYCARAAISSAVRARL